MTNSLTKICFADLTKKLDYDINLKHSAQGRPSPPESRSQSAICGEVGGGESVVLCLVQGETDSVAVFSVRKTCCPAYTVFVRFLSISTYSHRNFVSLSFFLNLSRYS